MREILFRGKRIHNGEWIEGFYMPSLDEGYHVIYDIRSPESGDYVDPNTLGQYIGLRDGNGTKIFEGDIVHHGLYNKYCKGEVDVVEWVGSSCGFEPFSDSQNNCGHCGGGIDPKYSVVIGNIHDNPELMKGENS